MTRPHPPSKPLPPISVEALPSGFGVRAGERAWRTPAGADLVVPSRGLAEGIAAELSSARLGGQLGRPRIDGLGLTRLAATAIDRIASDSEPTREALLAFADTDLVCYRVEGVPDLRASQDAAWQPLLDWLDGQHGARLAVVEGVMPMPQPREALDAIGAHLSTLDPFMLSGLGLATQTAGSLVVGLALAAGRIDAAEAAALANVDESYQNEKWGEDTEANEKRQLRAEDLKLAERFLKLLNGTSETSR